MQVIKTPLKDLLIIKPRIYCDNRGSFAEVYNKRKFEQLGVDIDFLQDNQSISAKNVIRGLHFQKPPHTQAKLVRVVSGMALDVAVDLRKNSDTYGQHYALILSQENSLQLFIPEGFAHGFSVLEDNTIFHYKCSQLYNKESERTIFFKDTTLNINWFIENPIVSEKDLEGVSMKDFISPF